jgi:bifunctional DNase/RNase
MFEAQAIAIEIEKIVPNRPMTHDLFKSFAHSFNYSVKEIVISDLKEGVFFAKIVCDNGMETVEIDSRPSDAIAIGIRFDAPIYTYEKIMSEAGIVLSDDKDEDDISELKKPVEKSSSPSTSTPQSKSDFDKLKNMSMDKLNELLEKMIQSEDYEKAAKIRDEINRRN